MEKKPSLPCLCANVRRASRVMTQLYDDAMRPYGLRSTQFSILQALSQTGRLMQGNLAEFLALDSTALTRSIQLLRKRGWVNAERGEDRRERWLSLSKSGEAELVRVQPAWEKIQASVLEKIGSKQWKQLLALSNTLANLPT